MHTNPLIAVARWHRNDCGFQEQDFLPLELAGGNSEALEHGLNADAHHALSIQWLSSRAWMDSMGATMGYVRDGA